MKKISLFLVASFLIILAACTNEESTNFSTDSKTDSQKSVNALSLLYTEMITSPRYVALEALRNDFRQKMHYTGNAASLKTESDFLNWIRINISQTTFANYNEAVTKWNIMKNENILVVQENIDFYHALGGEPRNSTVFDDILRDNMPDVEVFSSCDCWEEYQGSCDALNAEYAAAMKAIGVKLNKFEISPTDAGVDSNTLNSALCESLGAALNVYNHCIDDCEGED